MAPLPELRALRDVHLTVMQPFPKTRLDLSRDPPAIEVTLDVEAVRYVVRNNGSPVAGNRTDALRMALTWVLELTESTRAYGGWPRATIQPKRSRAGRDVAGNSPTMSGSR